MTEEHNDAATSIHPIRVGPWAGKKSSGSLRERFLVDASMAPDDKTSLGREAAGERSGRKNGPSGSKSNGSLRERFIVDGRSDTTMTNDKVHNLVAVSLGPFYQLCELLLNGSRRRLCIAKSPIAGNLTIR